MVLSGLTARVTHRWPKALAVALAFFLSVFALEGAIHSVHHLDDPQQAAKCQVLSVSQHVTGDSPDTVALEIPPADSGLLVIGSPNSLLPDLLFRPDQGRAPPSFRG